jgi:hypothetical protein
MQLTGWAYIDDDKAEWLADQAEKMLSSTYSISCELDRKATSLLPPVLALLTAMIIYGFTHHPESMPMWDYFKSTSWLWIPVFLIAAAVSLLMLTSSGTSEIYVAGSRPSTLANDHFINQPLTGMKKGYLQEIESRIEDNIARNNKRCRWIDRAVYLIASAPFFGAFIALIR